MKTIRWGIIGVGDVTEVKSGPGFQKAQNSELVAVMRRNGVLAKDYAGRHGVPKWYDDAGALIHDPDVDAVYIATPPHVHKDYTLMAAQAGKPVYVEKPMARNHTECQTMIETCRAAGVPLFVAYYRRALPRFVKIKELIDAGAIGQPRAVTVTLFQPPRQGFDADSIPWRLVPEIAGGGIFVDMGSHMLDFLDYVLGPVVSAQGFATNQDGHYSAEDSVAGSFVFESGVQGAGVWCFSAFEDVDRTEIVGTEGKLTFSCFDTAPVKLTTAQGTELFEIDNPPHVQQPLIQTVIDALNGTGVCPSTGESGARTSWVMDQMLAGYYTTQK
jgi:predicted dehydrogenase